MDGHIDFAVLKGCLNLQREDTLSPDLGDWLIEQPIPVGRDGDRLDIEFWPACLQRVFDRLCLPAGQVRSAASDPHSGPSACH
jgi:hypothetical protein